MFSYSMPEDKIYRKIQVTKFEVRKLIKTMVTMSSSINIPEWYYCC